MIGITIDIIMKVQKIILKGRAAGNIKCIVEVHGTISPGICGHLHVMDMNNRTRTPTWAFG